MASPTLIWVIIFVALSSLFSCVQERGVQYSEVDLTINYEDIYRENCTYSKKKGETNAKEMRSFDTLCTKLHLNYAQIDVAKQEIKSKINRSIVKNTLEVYNKGSHHFKTFDELIEIVQDTNYRFDCSNTTAAEQSINSILGIKNTYFLNSYGAAHPFSYIQYENYDLMTGEPIILEDLFKDVSAVKSLLYKKFTKQFKEVQWDFKGESDFKLPENIGLTQSTIIFQYNLYELGPYVNGMPAIEIPYSELKKFIKNDGYLGYLVN